MGEAGIIALHFLPSQIRCEPAKVAQRIKGPPPVPAGVLAGALTVTPVVALVVHECGTLHQRVCRVPHSYLPSSPRRPYMRKMHQYGAPK